MELKPFEDLFADSENTESDVPDDVIHESELADLLGLTRQRIGQLASDGAIKRVGRAKFSRRAAVRAYCAGMRDALEKRGALRAAPSDDLKAEKLRYEKERADALEIKNKAARRELVDAHLVEREWQLILRDLRAALLAVPSRCGSRLPSLTAYDIAEIDSEICATLEAIADGN